MAKYATGEVRVKLHHVWLTLLIPTGGRDAERGRETQREARSKDTSKGLRLVLQEDMEAEG